MERLKRIVSRNDSIRKDFDKLFALDLNVIKFLTNLKDRMKKVKLQSVVTNLY